MPEPEELNPLPPQLITLVPPPAPSPEPETVDESVMRLVRNYWAETVAPGALVRSPLPLPSWPTLQQVAEIEENREVPVRIITTNPGILRSVSPIQTAGAVRTPSEEWVMNFDNASVEYRWGNSWGSTWDRQSSFPYRALPDTRYPTRSFNALYVSEFGPGTFRVVTGRGSPLSQQRTYPQAIRAMQNLLTDNTAYLPRELWFIHETDNSRTIQLIHMPLERTYHCLFAAYWYLGGVYNRLIATLKRDRTRAIEILRGALYYDLLEIWEKEKKEKGLRYRNRWYYSEQSITEQSQETLLSWGNPKTKLPRRRADGAIHPTELYYPLEVWRKRILKYAQEIPPPLKLSMSDTTPV